jgi:hypothetical protein
MVHLAQQVVLVHLVAVAHCSDLGRDIGGMSTDLTQLLLDPDKLILTLLLAAHHKEVEISPIELLFRICFRFCFDILPQLNRGELVWILPILITQMLHLSLLLTPSMERIDITPLTQLVLCKRDFILRVGLQLLSAGPHRPKRLQSLLNLI